MTTIHQAHIRQAVRPASAPTAGVEGRLLNTLQAALSGEESPRGEKDEAGTGGRGHLGKSGPLKPLERSAGAPMGKATDRLPEGVDDLLRGTDELGLPAQPTPAQLKALTQDIRKGIGGDSGSSPTQPNVLDPATLTPLQKALFTALNGLPREALKRQPELLKAVREGLATEGGQQLALSINLLDAELVGDLSQPSRRRLLDGNSLIDPQVLARVIFNTDTALPAWVNEAAVAWIVSAQQSEAGRQKLNALCRRPQIEFKPEVAGTGFREEGRVIRLGRDARPAHVAHQLDQMAAAPLPNVGEDLSLDPVLMVERTLVFGDEVPLRTQQVLKHAANHSPTLKNMLLRIEALHGRINVGVDDSLPFEGVLRQRQILLKPAAPAEMASNLIFELANASQHDLLHKAWRHSDPLPVARVENSVPYMMAERMKRDPVAASHFFAWINSAQRNAFLAHSGAPRLERPRRAAETVQAYETYLLEQRDLLLQYAKNIGGEPSFFHNALEAAKSIEIQESNSVLLHAQVSTEVEGSIGAMFQAHPVLDQEALWRLAVLRVKLESMAPGNFLRSFLQAEVENGHFLAYFSDWIDSVPPIFSQPTWGRDGVASPQPSAHDVAGGGTAGTAAQPHRPVEEDSLAEADPAADAALSKAGAQAGTAARTAVDTAVARHGTGPRATLDKATHDGTLAPSQALAATMLEHPRIAVALRLGGKVLGAAALAAITYQLGQGIHTDVSNGDRSAPATRKVLEEILGGTALGIGGAAVGARIGVALGSLAGPVSAAVGGFIGGLFGGALGYAAGAKLVDEAIAAEKQPLAHLIDGLIGGKAPSKHDGNAIVQASGSEDDHVNAEELRQGLQHLYLEVDIGDRQLAMLINTYGNRGAGALSPRDIDRAFADGALVVDKDSRVTADPFEFSLNLDTPEQRSRAVQLARRLVALGASDEGDDLRLNTEELMDALEDAGYNRSIDEGRFTRLVAAYDKSGDGALDEAEVSLAIQDGALDFDTEGGVYINDQTITGQVGDSAANIGLRTVKAGSEDDLWANASEMKNGMKAAGYDPKLDDEEWQALLDSHGRNGVIDAEGVGKAISTGTLVIEAGGDVRLDRNVP